MSVVKKAYEHSRLALPNNPIKAHEVRAISTSLALVRGVALHKVLQAAYWHSQTTFINYYLRDIESRREDGRYGIQKLVLAQASR